MLEHRKHSLSAPDSGPLRIYEIGGGNGTLARDVLDWLRRERPDVYEGTSYTCVEISAKLAAQQYDTVVTKVGGRRRGGLTLWGTGGAAVRHRHYKGGGHAGEGIAHGVCGEDLYENGCAAVPVCRDRVSGRTERGGRFHCNVVCERRKERGSMVVCGTTVAAPGASFLNGVCVNIKERRFEPDSSEYGSAVCKCGDCAGGGYACGCARQI
eukprot:363999-Chlamydomonas_euryale.AAC.13